IEVDLARLDDALPERRVDFIKMDVQGHELPAFRGMERVLADNPGVEVYFEFWPHGLAAAGSPPDALLEHLRARGFRLFRPAGDRLESVGGWDALRPQLPGKRFTNLLASRTRVPGLLPTECPPARLSA